MGVVTETVELDPRVRFVDATSMEIWQMVLPSDGLPGPAAPPGFKAGAQIALVTMGERYLVAFPRVEVDAVLEGSLATIAALDGATVVLVVEFDRPGHAVARLLGAGDPARAAMAVAVVKYSWAWDETEEILVETGVTTHAVRVVYAAPTFTVQATLRGE